MKHTPIEVKKRKEKILNLINHVNSLKTDEFIKTEYIDFQYYVMLRREFGKLYNLKTDLHIRSSDMMWIYLIKQ